MEIGEGCRGCRRLLEENCLKKSRIVCEEEIEHSWRSGLWMQWIGYIGKYVLGEQEARERARR